MSEDAIPAAPKTLKRHDLTQGPIAKTLLMFSLPVLGSSALQSLNGSINAIWVGRLLGPDALAATANVNLIMFFLIGIIFGVGMATTVMIGQAVGARDMAMLKRVVGTSATFFFILSVAVAAGGLAMTEEIVAWLGTPASVTPLAEEYLRITFWAMPFIYMFNYFMMTLRGAGDSRTPFRFMALAAALDIGFNPLLILGVGPFPQMGIGGAAMSTLIGQAVSLAAMVGYLYWRKSDVRITREELHFLKPDLEILKIATLKGLPMGVQMAVVSVASVMVMAMINGYGAVTAAAYGVAAQIWTYVQMPAISIGSAASSMAAQNVGAQKWDRVERTASAGVWLNIAMTGALVIIVYLADPYLAALFLPGQPEAIRTAEHINALTLWANVAFGVTFVLFGVVRATGVALPQLVILAICMFGVRLTFAEMLEPHWGADAIWWSFPAGMISAMLLAAAYYRWGPWRKARLMAPVREVEDVPATGVGAPSIEPGLVDEERR